MSRTTLELQISRDTLVELGLLTSEKIGRERIYKNERLFKIIKETDRD